MDRYSIVDAHVARDPALPLQETSPPKQQGPPRPREELRFPGEDGGESLATWARRDLEATLQLLADRAQYITGASGATIALRDGENIICRASSGSSAPAVGSYLEVSSGLSGESVRTRKVLRCNDAEQDPRVNRESCRQLGIGSLLVMPLVRDDQVVGIFEIFGDRPNTFQERDIQALERLGEMVNTALDQVSNPRSQPVPAAADVRPAQGQEPPAKTGESASAAKLQPETEEEEILSVDETPAPPQAAKLPQPTTAPDPSTQTVDPKIVAALLGTPVQKPAHRSHAIGTCAACGFPISEGRTLCLDCEAKPGNSSAMAAKDNAPAFLADLSDEQAQPSSFRHWLLTHKYLLGTIAVIGSTVVILLFR